MTLKSKGTSRAKGARTERQFIAELKERLPKNSRISSQLARNLEQYRAEKQADLVVVTRRATLAIEIKARDTMGATKPAWIDQVCAAAEVLKAIPVLVVKYDRRPFQISLPIYSFYAFYDSLRGTPIEIIPTDNRRMSTISLDEFIRLLEALDADAN